MSDNKCQKQQWRVTVRHYKYIPIHAAIGLLHDKNYSSFDRFCTLQFRDSTYLAYTRQLKCCIYDDDIAPYRNLCNVCGGGEKSLNPTNIWGDLFLCDENDRKVSRPSILS